MTQTRERRRLAGESSQLAGGTPALVCLAGVVNYRDERSPTEAMTPTVAEG
jgi:hypothetical protein